jgi:uncharacterized protein YkwD
MLRFAAVALIVLIAFAAWRSPVGTLPFLLEPRPRAIPTIGGSNVDAMRPTIATAAHEAFLSSRPTAIPLPDLDAWLSDTADAYLRGVMSLEQAIVRDPELPNRYLRDFRPFWLRLEGTPGRALSDPATFGREAVTLHDASEFGSGSHYAIGVAVSASGDRAVAIVATATPIPRLYQLPERPSTLTVRPADPTAVIGIDAGQRLSDVADFLAAVEAEIFAIVNDYRAANALPALLPDPELDRVARRHSIDMAQRNYFAHTDPDGLGPHERILRDTNWVDLITSAENLTMHGGTQGYLDAGPTALARAMMDGWIHSEGHRLNLVNTTITRLGVGVAFDERDDYFYGTQKFALRGR